LRSSFLKTKSWIGHFSFFAREMKSPSRLWSWCHFVDSSLSCAITLKAIGRYLSPDLLKIQANCRPKAKKIQWILSVRISVSKRARLVKSGAHGCRLSIVAFFFYYSSWLSLFKQPVYSHGFISWECTIHRTTRHQERVFFDECTSSIRPQESDYGPVVVINADDAGS
jgi:hypothetical protein